MRNSKIAVAIITKNEEKNIADCIKSVKGWADEIIVVDGYSTDSTVSIAKNLGAKVIKHEFEDDFSKERNIGMENSSAEWVLHLDADDRVTEEFKNKVDKIIDLNHEVDVYKFRRKSFFLGHFMEYGGWYHYIPNLVRRSIRFRGALHERPIYKGKAGVIEADIEHHPFQSLSQFIKRHDRYSSIEAGKIYKRERDAKLSVVKKMMIRRSIKLFWKIYVKKKGYKEGMYGLVFAILFAFMNFLIWAKYWELCERKRRTV